ncbi:MBL fold metallo-hydrolase [Flagellimonas allohymeniacidonis]|uniref:Metallo-beta-lactamase domain-containing protein n=1 Tax=Flagellimonas allohymeniacidonis TaxID=2517819 RepID=A0A4Q8QGA5_9FLAO|nr:MBL fold metallo-hydrolase [Allomuricauda hymeniacidonis]TAI49592.1 hypothetical protein EW142_07285 [Allomuricauda hymeniacidonis]
MSNSTVTRVQIRMYRMGTGDCFVLKFFSGNKITFKMMIDAGVWQKGKDHIEPFVKDIKKYVNNQVDVLVVTHEHMDHVLAFQRCKDLFTQGFDVKQVWMGWTEEDGDPKVEKWKKNHGEKKKALAMAASFLNQAIASPDFMQQFQGHKYENQMLNLRENQASIIEDFAELNTGLEQNLAIAGEYKGAMEGMRIVKEDMNVDGFRYFKPGQVVKDHPGAKGLKFYILGPPELHDKVEKESGGPGESFEHSHNMEDHRAFSEAINMKYEIELPSSKLPFDEKFIYTDEDDDSAKMRNQELLVESDEVMKTVKEKYEEGNWRRIDYDWLFSSGNLALRMNSLTNNLSLAIAIEFESTGQVLLFPGDAEYGSWSSWHTIDWGNEQDPAKKHLTEDLLNRTIFYKVAHHMSHNGTAERLGLDMMTDPKLTAMATLDYNVISKGWKNTMPNKFILDDLLHKTKGRLIFSNEAGIPYNKQTTLTDRINQERTRMDSNERADFQNNFKTDDVNGLYHELTIRF